MLTQVRVRGVASGLVDNMRLILPSESVAVRVGDVSHVGIDISTSSFGRSAIHLSPMVWRLVCTNGLRSSERRGQLSFRHVGDSNRLRNGIAEAIPSALAHAQGLMTQWQKAVTFMVEDVQKQVEQMREALSLHERTAFEKEVTKEAQTSVLLPERLPLYSVRERAHVDCQERRSGSPARAGSVRGGCAAASPRSVFVSRKVLRWTFQPAGTGT